MKIGSSLSEQDAGFLQISISIMYIYYQLYKVKIAFIFSFVSTEYIE